jgi:hypothetical protein
MIRISLITLIFITIFATTAQPAFYHRNHLIRKGMAITEVLKHCGEPFHKDVYSVAKTKFHRNSLQTIFITYEVWGYNFGPTKFIQTLTFRNGILTSTKAGGYGFYQ